jgi:hypothetical protein
MPYMFKSKNDLSSEERGILSTYLVEMEEDTFGNVNYDERTGSYDIIDSNKIIIFSIFTESGDYNIKFKIMDNGNIEKINTDDEQLIISDDLENKIIDTLKNIIISEHTGGGKYSRRARKTRRARRARKTRRARRARKTRRARRVRRAMRV